MKPAVFLLLLSLTLIAAMLLAGCAQTRYLTAEQDAEFKAACEPHGCAIVPWPLWQQIEKLLGSAI